MATYKVAYNIILILYRLCKDNTVIVHDHIPFSYVHLCMCVGNKTMTSASAMLY